MAEAPEALLADPKLPAGAKVLAAVLWARVHHSAREHVCWPTAGWLARATGQHERTVRRQLEQLEAGGWIERTPRQGRRAFRLLAGPATGQNARYPDTSTRVETPDNRAFCPEPGHVDPDRDVREPGDLPGTRAPGPGPTCPGGRALVSADPGPDARHGTNQEPTKNQPRSPPTPPATSTVVGSGHVHELDMRRRTIAGELGAEVPALGGGGQLLEGLQRAVNEHGWDEVVAVCDATWRQVAAGDLEPVFARRMFVGDGFGARRDAYRKAANGRGCELPNWEDVD